MFRRTKSSEPASSASAASTSPGATAAASAVQGKGRPTPTRKEAEAAAKAAAKAGSPRGGGRATASTREQRLTNSREIRDGIKRGDERYLTARDRGPVRRFVRDYVDSRINIGEFTLPLLFASLLASSAGYRNLGAGVLNATVLLVAVDSVWMSFRLRRELRRRFPDGDTRRTTVYALMRSLQMRFMRVPKAQTKLGQKLPDTYR